MDQKEKQWQPPWKIHLPVWAVSLGVSFWALREIGAWAILIFVGIMIFYGLIIGGIQQQKQQRATEYEKFRDKLIEDPKLRALYEADRES